MKGNSPDPEAESVLIDLKNDEWPLVISFAGLGDQFQFRNLLATFDVNVIYLRDLKHNWYLNGVPGAGKSVQEVNEFLQKKIREHKFQRVITLGVSAGGFAAMLYGSLLRANTIMAFSPQTFMDRFHRILYWDRRWMDREAEIYEGNSGNRAFLDIKPIIQNFDGWVNILYDKNHRLDRLHVRRLNIKNVTHITSKGGGHSLARHLKETGKLTEYIREVLK